MQEELKQFNINDVWKLIPKPKGKSIIETKWGLQEQDEQKRKSRQEQSKTRGQRIYTQEERIDYDETYVPVARLEAIKLLLAFACYKNFRLF